MEERMKEMEKKEAAADPAAANPAAESPAFPVDEAAPVPIAKPPKRKNRVLHLLSEMWPAYLIEVVVIILGISITLVLEEWRDNGKEERLAAIYKENLATDIEADEKSLQYAIDGTAEILKAGKEIDQFVRDPDGHPLSVGRLNMDVRGLLSRPKFLSQEATFSDLKSSGNLHLIKDIDLKNMLFTYYSKTANIRETQEAEQQATIMLSGRYFLQWFSMDDSTAVPGIHDPGGLKALGRNIEFRNHVLIRISNRAELLTLYKEADQLAFRLRAILRNYKE
jgi:hypothetical protein